MVAWLRREWRFFFFVVGTVVLWHIECTSLGPICRAAVDLSAGQFLTDANLRGANTKDFVGRYLCRAKRRGELIDQSEVYAPEEGRAVVAVQVSEKQFSARTITVGACADAWDTKADKPLAKDLKVVSVAFQSSGTGALVLFSVSRSQDGIGKLAGGENIAFAIIGCSDNDTHRCPSPTATPTPTSTSTTSTSPAFDTPSPSPPTTGVH
jgi:hypothetical protein